jgi:hypothetical protein
MAAEDSVLHPLLAGLQNTLTQDQYAALQPVLEHIDQRLGAAESTAISTSQLQSVFETALSNADFTVQVPTQA